MQWGGGGGRGMGDVRDLLLMRCGRGLAEGALSVGSRCSQTGALSWHRGNAHFLLGASLPSAQAPQGRPQLLGRQSQVKERHPMALILAFLPHSGLDFQKWLLTRVTKTTTATAGTTTFALACHPGGGTNLLDSPSIRLPTAVCPSTSPLR